MRTDSTVQTAWEWWLFGSLCPGTLGFRICSISLSISVRTVLIVFQMLIKEGVSGVSIPEDGIHKLEKEGRSNLSNERRIYIIDGISYDDDNICDDYSMIL